MGFISLTQTRIQARLTNSLDPRTSLLEVISGNGGGTYSGYVAIPESTGWSWGYVSAIDSNGRTIWIADAHCDGKR